MVLRFPRWSRVLIVVMTTAALLGLPLQVAAHGGGYHSKAEFKVTALTDAVSPGQAAAFQVFLRSDGSDAFDKVRLEGKAPGGTITSAPDGCWTSGASFSCNLGKLKSGKTMTLQFVYATPAVAGSLKLSASLKVEYWHWGHKKTKEAFTGSASTAIIDSPDFFGGWQPSHASTMSFSTAGIGGANEQTTSVQVPPVGSGYPLRLAEVDESIRCGHKTITGFGEAVDMSIANGATLSPHLTLTLTYTKAAVGYRSAHDIRFVHQTDDGGCQFPPRGCNYHNDGFCFDAWWTGHGYGKKLVIRVELPSNGRGKGL
jgi:hypothetical protein